MLKKFKKSKLASPIYLIVFTFISVAFLTYYLYVKNYSIEINNIECYIDGKLTYTTRDNCIHFSKLIFTPIYPTISPEEIISITPFPDVESESNSGSERRYLDQERVESFKQRASERGFSDYQIEEYLKMKEAELNMSPQEFENFKNNYFDSKAKYDLIQAIESLKYSRVNCDYTLSGFDCNSY